MREPLPTRLPQRDFHPGLTFALPLWQFHSLHIALGYKQNALLRSIEDAAAPQITVTRVSLLRDLLLSSLSTHAIALHGLNLAESLFISVRVPSATTALVPGRRWVRESGFTGYKKFFIPETSVILNIPKTLVNSFRYAN